MHRVSHSISLFLSRYSTGCCPCHVRSPCGASVRVSCRRPPPAHPSDERPLVRNPVRCTVERDRDRDRDRFARERTNPNAVLVSVLSCCEPKQTKLTLQYHRGKPIQMYAPNKDIDSDTKPQNQQQNKNKKPKQMRKQNKTKQNKKARGWGCV